MSERRKAGKVERKGARGMSAADLLMQLLPGKPLDLSDPPEAKLWDNSPLVKVRWLDLPGTPESWLPRDTARVKVEQGLVELV